MFVATINRTLKSFGLAIIGAEYVLGWLPQGTHQWEKFITPDELRQELSHSGMSIADLRAWSTIPLADEWRRSPDTAVNYMLMATRTGTDRRRRPIKASIAVFGQYGRG